MEMCGDRDTVWLVRNFLLVCISLSARPLKVFHSSTIPSINPCLASQNRMAMDNASQLEIINLLREDAEVLGTTTDRTDLMLALQVWQEEVDHYVALEEDRRMALGAVRTTHENRGFEIAAQLEEAQAAEDRRLAIRLAGQQRPHPQERRPPGKVHL